MSLIFSSKNRRIVTKKLNKSQKFDLSYTTTAVTKWQSHVIILCSKVYELVHRSQIIISGKYLLRQFFSIVC